ncbi:MAG: AMP-binding protein [Alphaproteobacteria bacterium]|nr:AMP-binding protein [Alphaproteobacteria bacterium]
MAQPSSDGPLSQGPVLRARLHRIVAELLGELRPERAVPRLADESRLDHDLGLDSLGRVELLMRLERAFAVRLGEKILAEAETMRDLEIAIAAARPESATRKEEEAAPAGPARPAAEPFPAEASSLSEMLEWHVARHGERVHVHFEGENAGSLSYGDLWHGALKAAGGLMERGIAPGERVALMLPTGADFLTAFFAVQFAGAVPVPVYPPYRASQIEEHLRRQAAILRNASARLLILPEEGRRLAGFLRGHVDLRAREATLAELAAGTPLERPLRRQASDMALVQYTSGSTGDPKGVVLSHANLLANIRAMGSALRADSADVFVSWLPLYHDMGLIGAWLGSLYHGALAVIMSPLHFLSRPERWLRAIHRHRGTLSAAPNFAYELCLAKIPEAELAGLDLSSWRVAANGAEPVSAATIRAFATRFAPYGFRPETMLPVYGLAECAVGLAFPAIGHPPQVDRIDRGALLRSGIARPVEADGAGALELVACGHALPGHQIRLADAQGRELPDRREGRVQFRGPSSTEGYLDNPERTRALFDGEWLESGDLGYSIDGELVLTGRSKDIIIRAGRNIHPQELEEAVGDIPGIRRGCVAAFGARAEGEGTERLVVVAETKEQDAERREALRRRIAELAASLLDAPPDEIVLAPPHSVLKTSSGKIRRSACRELYERGAIGRAPLPAWLQLARLAAQGLPQRAARGWRMFTEHLHAAWFWSCLGLIGAATWCTVMLLPGRGIRWRIVRGSARAFLAATSLSPRLVSPPSVRIGPAVLVANHASYLDSLMLVALLDGPASFVAKMELSRQWFAGPFLRRIGAVFVERFDPDAAAGGAGEVLRTAREGMPVVVFPEGTLSRRPGLLAFRLGAFWVATQAGLPVVPVVLRGTRAALRGGQWFPRRATIEAEFLPPLVPRGADWAAMVGLRDAVRQKMLAHLGEPDLAAEDPEIAPAKRNEAADQRGRS